MVSRLRLSILLLALSAALGACATASPGASEHMRVLVRMAPPEPDVEGIVALAAHTSQRAVRYLAAAGDGWHALSIACDSHADCDEALQRLASNRLHFRAAHRDGRKKIVSPQ